MNSSGRHLSIPPLFKLADFYQSCDQYLTRLLVLALNELMELMTKDQNIRSNDKKKYSNGIFEIIKALDYERTLAGNLAGLMDILWKGEKWSLGTTEFVTNLEPEVREFIMEQLNALAKKNFNEEDLRLILQDILISRMSVLASLFTDQDQYKILLFIDQCKILSEIKHLLSICMETNDEVLREKSFGELNTVVMNNKSLLENLMLTSRTSFFSKSKTFLSEAQEILTETRSTIHHRTP